MLPKEFARTAETAADNSFIDPHLLIEGRVNDGRLVRVYQGHPDEKSKAAHAIGDFLVATAATSDDKNDYQATIVPGGSLLVRYPSSDRIDVVIGAPDFGFSTCIANPGSDRASGGIVYNQATPAQGRSPFNTFGRTATFETLHSTDPVALPVPEQRHVEAAPAFTEPTT